VFFQVALLALALPMYAMPLPTATQSWGPLLAQPALFGQAALLAQAEGEPRQLSPLQMILGNPITLVAGLAMLFFVMVVLPERRRKAELQNKLAGIKKNDRVLTIGGIYGTVVNAAPDSTDVTLRIDDSNNTRIRITRAAVASVITEKAAEDS
jgi:preprotein translocase subunit YajC